MIKHFLILSIFFGTSLLTAADKSVKSPPAEEGSLGELKALLIENSRKEPISLNIKIDSRAEMTFVLPSKEILRFIDYSKTPKEQMISAKGTAIGASGEQVPIGARGEGIVFQFTDQGSPSALVGPFTHQSIIIKRPAFIEIIAPDISDVTIKQLNQ